MLVVAGCARGPSSSSGRASITIGTAMPQSNNTTVGLPAIVDLLTVEAPIGIGWDGKPVPKAIDKWEWSPDGLTLRLHVQPGVVFHDGTVLTNALAADILREALTPAPANPLLSRSVQSVVPDGQEEIVIRAGQPEGFLLSEISNANFSLPGHPHVGTGPFRLASDAEQVFLQAFDRYRGGRPEIDDVRITRYATQRQAWAAMMRGESDVLYDVSAESLDFVEAESSIETHSFLRAYYHALVFNLTLPTFASRDVRRALNAAVDRQKVVDVGLRKRGMPADGPIWPYHFAHSSDQPSHRYDPGLAGRLLDGVGLTEGRIREAGRMPSRFRFTCLVPREDQRLQRIALLVQRQLYDVGVDMDVELTALRDLRGRIFSGRFEAALSEFASTRSLSFVYSIWHSPAHGEEQLLNLHYASADAALDRLRAAHDEASIRTAVADLQRALYDDPPAVFLDWMQTSRAVRRNIEVPNEGARDIIGSMPKWRPVAGRGRDE